MNIFATDKSPIECARALDNRRVVKMILESTQLLNNASTFWGPKNVLTPHTIDNVPYRASHVQHPCSIWTRSTRSNYEWLLEHLVALLKEYTKQYSKIHRCQEFIWMLRSNTIFIPEGPLTEFSNCSMFKEQKTVTIAYQMTMASKWNLENYKWLEANNRGKSVYKPAWRDKIPQWVLDWQEEQKYRMGDMDVEGAQKSN